MKRIARRPVTREHRRIALEMRIEFAPDRITETDIERAVEGTGWSEDVIRGKIADAVARRLEREVTA